MLYEQGFYLFLHTKHLPGFIYCHSLCFYWEVSTYSATKLNFSALAEGNVIDRISYTGAGSNPWLY